MAMGISRALKETRKRFGPDASCQVVPSGNKLVGKIVLGMLFQSMGSGTTWEEALEDADSRLKPREAK